MPRYLIKFVTQLSYAESLQSGKLFMRPADYYHKLEIGQGDIAEGATSHFAMIYKNKRLPIYCMYAVKNEDICQDGNIHIPRRLVEDFKCTQGYAVVISRDTFESRLTTVQTEGYALYSGEIVYSNLPTNTFPALMNAGNPVNLFIKRSYFKYQNEFRVVICRPVPPKQDHEESQKDNCEESQKQDSVKYSFQSDLLDCSYIVSLTNSKSDADEYIIPLRRGEL